MINHTYRHVNIVLNQEDFDRALAEMTEEEFNLAWEQLGKLVRIRGKRIKELWEET
jgi:hypothetical protein